MGNVIAGFTMSLDGFVAGPNHEVGRLLGWYFSGDTEVSVVDGMVFKISRASAELFRENLDAAGSHVTGRGDFDASRAWGGKHPLNVPVFIVTHRVPPEWAGEDSPFTFVTEGVERAVELAQAVAGGKNVVIAGPQITQQCLKAGLLDEIHIDLAPILLGTGIRLFEHLDIEPVDLEKIKVIDAPGVTHLRFRIVKGRGGA